MIKATVQIRLKTGVLDAQGKAIEGVIDQYGVKGLEKIRVGRLIELNFSNRENVEAQVDQLCQEILVNHEMEEYSYTIEERGDE